jgi:uncharacterized protein (DUF1330 family)
VDGDASCVIGHITIKDAGEWAEYRDKVPATLSGWGARLIIQGSFYGTRTTGAGPRCWAVRTMETMEA